MSALSEIINPKQEPPTEHRIPDTVLTRLKQLAMFKIRRNFYDERFLSIIDNKRYVALRDAKLISNVFSTSSTSIAQQVKRPGLLNGSEGNGQLTMDNGECLSDRI